MSYHGPPLDVTAYLTALPAAAAAAGFALEQYGEAHGWPLHALRKPARAAAAPTLYLSAGIHGDEPAGPLALAHLLREHYFSETYHWVLFPALNPGGLAKKIRTNAAGLDVNRDYRALVTPEAARHVAWLDREFAAGRGRYALCLCLHEDWESKGFYLYELNRAAGPLLGRAALAAADPVCGLDRSPVIEEMAADGGLITRPWAEIEQRPDQPEAIFLAFRQTPRSLTFEAPSAQPLERRVAALAAATRATIAEWERQPAETSGRSDVIS